MKHYFLSGHFYMTKNKAHEELQKFAQQYNHTLIDQEKLNRLKIDFRMKTERVNARYKRCHNIDLQARSFDGKSFTFTVESNFQLSATPVNRYELSEPVEI